MNKIIKINFWNYICESKQYHVYYHCMGNKKEDGKSAVQM